MPHFQLYLLGAPRLTLDGKPVSVDTRKAIALLAYLAVTATVDGIEAHTRDALATLLWPDLDQSRARAALRRTLSPLRQALNQGVLTVTREMISIPTDVEMWLDVREFRCLLAEAARYQDQANDAPVYLERLTQAVELYRDGFMAGFTLRDAPGFDDWQFLMAELLQREVVTALDQLAHGYGVCGKTELAIRYAHRRLALDPLSEQGHRNLMLLYAWAGQRNAALRQYRECVRVLEQELGVSPLAETKALYEQILANTLEAPAPRTPATPIPVLEPQTVVAQAIGPSQLPLVGRASEQNTMRERYRDAATHGHFLVIEGEAGVGKTRLAETFIQEAPGIVASARCYEGEAALALGPFVEALRSALDHAPAGWQHAVPKHHLAEASRLLPELARDVPAPGVMAGPGAQSRFFEAVFQTLLAFSTSSRGTGILFVDDVHWADNASLDLLVYLVRRLKGRSLLILVTWRSEAVPAGHRLRALLAEAQRHGHGTCLTLPRLSRDDVQALLQQVQTDRGLRSQHLEERLYHETEGLPFFIVEYLKAWAATAEEDWEIPHSVRDLLHARLATVDEIGWQFLNTAAVIGRSFDFDTCRLASGRSEDEAVAALEQLLDRGLITEVRRSGDPGYAPRYDFTHNQIRNLVYEETSLARRRLLHRRVVEALAQRNRGHALSGQMAHHYRIAGLEAEAAEAYKQAGTLARSLYANAEALNHLQMALALGHPDAAELRAAIGDLQTLLGNYQAALSSYEAALALALPDNQATLEHKTGSVYHRLGAWQRAESHYQAALTASTLPNTAQQAHIYADWSLTAHHQGDTGRAVALAEQARTLAEQAGDRLALARAYNILGLLSRHQGQPETAIDYLQKSLSLAKTAGSIPARLAALNNLGLVHKDREATEQALAFIGEALQLCHMQGDRHREAALHNNIADLYHAAGQEEQAMEHLKLAAAIFVEIGGETRQWQPEIWMLTEW